MTRAESYDAGWHEGRRWAERDLRDNFDAAALADDVLTWVKQNEWNEISANSRAWNLGVARGYRQAVADFESGRTSRETFDQAPLGKP